MSDKDNISELIQTHLFDHYSKQTLRMLCYDTPFLQSIYHSFDGTGISRKKIIKRIIKQAHRRKKLPQLHQQLTGQEVSPASAVVGQLKTEKVGVVAQQLNIETFNFS